MTSNPEQLSGNGTYQLKKQKIDFDSIQSSKAVGSAVTSIMNNSLAQKQQTEQQMQSYKEKTMEYELFQQRLASFKERCAQREEEFVQQIEKVSNLTQKEQDQIFDISQKVTMAESNNNSTKEKIKQTEDKVEQSKKSYNRKLEYKKEFFTKAVLQKQSLTADLKSQIENAEKSLEDMLKDTKSMQNSIQEKQQQMEQLTNDIKDTKAMIEERKGDPLKKQQIQQLKSKIEKLQSTLEQKLNDKTNKQSEILQSKSQGQALSSQKMQLEMQKEELIQEEEEAQDLEDKIYKTKKKIEDLVEENSSRDTKISSNIDTTNDLKSSSQSLQHQIDLINSFNKAVRDTYDLQDDVLEVGRKIEDLFANQEQLESNLQSNKDKLLFTLGNLKGSSAGGIGFIIKQSLIEKKSASLREDLAQLQQLKDALKGKQKEGLMKIVQKEMDSLEREDIEKIVKTNEGQSEEVRKIKEMYDECEMGYEGINKDFMYSQDRLRKTYIQEINIRIRDMQSDIQGTMKIYSRTNEEVTNFLTDQDTQVKKLRPEDKHREFVAIEMKATQLKDDISKFKTSLLVKEAKYEETKSTCKKDLIHMSLANLFKLIQTILGLDTQISESKKESSEVSQRSKDLITLFRDIQKQVHKDLYNAMMNELKMRQGHQEASGKKSQSLGEIMRARKEELGEIEMQLSKEDEELNIIYRKYEQLFNEATKLDEQSSHSLRQVQTQLSKLEKQSNRIQKDTLNVQETYKIIDELKQFDQPISSINSHISDSTNKAISIEKSLKELQNRIKSERIASFEGVQTSAFRSIDKMLRSINRVNGIMRIIDKNQQYLTDEFNDMEKSQEHIAFRNEMDQKFKELERKKGVKDELKQKLDEVEQVFDLKIKEIENNSGREFQKLQGQDEVVLEEIKQEVDDLDGRFSEEVNELKEMIDQLNSKYRYKKSKYQMAQMLKQVKTEQLSAFIDSIDSLIHKLPSIENQLNLIGTRQIQSEQSRLESLQTQIDSALSQSKNLLQTLKKQLQLVEEESEPLDQIESREVKTKKIKDIIEILENINISDLEQQTESALQAVKQVEKGTDSFVQSLRNTKMANTEQTNKEIEDILKSLDLALKEVIIMVDDFKDEVNEAARKKGGKLKNKEKLLGQCEKYGKTLEEIQRDRNRMKEEFDVIKQKLGEIDVKTAVVTDVEALFEEAQKIENKTRGHIQTTQNIKTEIQKTKKEFIEDNIYTDQREAYLQQVFQFEEENQKTIEDLQKQLEKNNEYVANFEQVYQAMLQSEDYQPRVAIEKKMKRIQQIKQECKRIEDAIKSAQEASAQIKKKDPESMTDLNDLARTVKESERISQKLTQESKASSVVTTGFKKKRSKMKDAQVSKFLEERKQELQKAKEQIQQEMTLIQSLEKSLKDRQNDPNSTDKLSAKDEEEVRRTIDELKRELNRVESAFMENERNLNSVQKNIESKDLENEDNLGLIASNITSLQEQRDAIKNLFNDVQKVSNQVRQRSTLIQTIDTEMRLKSVISQIQNLDPQIEENKQILNEVNELCTAYNGYTSDAEEEEFHKSILTTGKEVGLETDANAQALQEITNETRNILQQFNQLKRENDGNLPANQLEEYQILIQQLEKRYQKYEQRVKTSKITADTDKEKLGNFKLEEKFERRKQEISEIGDNFKDLETDVNEIKAKIQKEVMQNQNSKFLAKFIEELYPMYGQMEKIFEEALPVFQDVKDLQDDHSKRQKKISKDPKQRLKSHYDNIELKKKIAEFMAQANAIHKKVRDYLQEIEKKFKMKPVRKLKQLYKAVDGDEVDQLFAYWFNKLGICVPIKRLGGGYYMFGTKKIYCKIINGKLVVRVGGGFMGIEDFILQYGEMEAEKYAQMEEEKKNPKERSKTGFNLVFGNNRDKKDDDDEDDASPVFKKAAPATQQQNKKVKSDLPQLLPDDLVKSKDDSHK